jgi:PAS domain S-box-containing protein
MKERIIIDSDVSPAGVNATGSVSMRGFRRLLQFMSDGFVVMTMSGDVRECNDRFSAMLGYRTTELTKLTNRDITPAAWLGIEEKIVAEQLIPHGECDRFEKEYRKKDGSLLSASVRLLLVSGEEGGDTLWGVVRDLSAEKRKEKELNREREFFHTFVEQMADGVVSCDDQGNLLQINRTAREWHGLNALLLPGPWTGHDNLYAADGITPLSPEELPLTRAFRGVTLRETPVVLRAAGQPVRYLRVSGGPIRDAAGRRQGAVIVMRDESRTRRMESAFRESERKLSTLISNLPGVVYRCANSRERTMEFISEGCSVLTGYETSELVNNVLCSFGDIIHADDRDHVWDTIQAALLQQKDYQLTYRIRTADQELRWVGERGRGVWNESGVMDALEGFITDISERMKAEVGMQNMKNHLANIIDSMPSMLVGLGRDGTVTQWNREAHHATGITPGAALGKSITVLLPEFAPWIEVLQGEIETNSVAAKEKIPLDKNGEHHFYDLILFPLVAEGREGAVLRIDDVTERTRIQELMIQTEKMMSVGGLAAGMAHEINNPLGIISQAAQNIERRLSPSLPANVQASQELNVDLRQFHEYLERRQVFSFVGHIREASDRAARIVANMLQFSRQSPSTIQPASLAVIMDKAVDLAAKDYDLKRKFDFRSIDIVREFAVDLPDVPAVVVEIEQVVLNLLKNAAHALISNPPERKPRITLRLYQEPGYAVMEVEDNGPGMAEGLKRRIFEPFFTTKEPGVGTGLGLSVSYMIVTGNHKGVMEVTSAPDAGARFTIHLPLTRVPQPN